MECLDIMLILSNGGTLIKNGSISLISVEIWDYDFVQTTWILMVIWVANTIHSTFYCVLTIFLHGRVVKDEKIWRNDRNPKTLTSNCHIFFIANSDWGVPHGQEKFTARSMRFITNVVMMVFWIKRARLEPQHVVWSLWIYFFFHFFLFFWFS
jgi:hypothetical protein